MDTARSRGVRNSRSALLETNRNDLSAHVHLNEPGRTEWEGFWTGTRAAASGGITTIVDMPLNSIPPTTTVENLRIKQKAATGQCWTDVAFWGGMIPGNQVRHPIILLCSSDNPSRIAYCPWLMKVSEDLKDF